MRRLARLGCADRTVTIFDLRGLFSVGEAVGNYRFCHEATHGTQPATKRTERDVPLVVIYVVRACDCKRVVLQTLP